MVQFCSYSSIGTLVLLIVLDLATDVYLSRFTRDSIGPKLLGTLIPPVYLHLVTVIVWFLVVLETVFTVFMISVTYRLFGSGWGDFDVLTYLDWSWLGTPVLNGLSE
jgi:hypothetical protein